MDNPHHTQQTAILTRIIGNIEKVNESMLALNNSVSETNVYNAKTAEVVELWTQYMENIKFNTANSAVYRPTTGDEQGEGTR
ncbi:hypothetical protein T439DRAFT_323739 [Meredithblackwellia eburnea MCA 4105]